jgi:hypothetical protein
MTNWKQDLNEFLREKEHQDPEAQTAIERYASAASRFYGARVNPAFEAFASELERHGRKVFFSPSGEVRENRVRSSMEVYFEGRLEFDYILRADISSSGIRLGKEIASIDEERIAFAAQKTGKWRHVESLYTVNGSVVATEDIIQDKISEVQIIREIIQDYKPHALSHPLRPKTSSEKLSDHDDISDDEWWDLVLDFDEDVQK